MSQPEEEIEYEVVVLQADGETRMQVAGTSGPNALNEAMRYAHMYTEEGPVTVFKIIRTVVTELPST